MKRFALLLLVACAPAATPTKPAPLGGRAAIVADARALDGFATSPLAKRYLAATKDLPHVAPRVLYRTKDKSTYITAEAWARDPAPARYDRFEADEDLYYETKYGSPLSYVRPLDVLAARGIDLAPGAHLLDFGYGYVGHLRLLASIGVDATGVDVDPLLPALYSAPGDQGAIGSGHLRLLDGHFPSDAATVTAVGTGYDVVLSKNVLKRGYLHPERPADPKLLIDLGPDDAVVHAFHDALRPGGYMLIFNICPALTPPDKPFVPWSDGRSPFTRDTFEKQGFDVLAFDVDDFPAVNRMAHLLKWGDDPESPWDVDHDLSALYTLVRRR